MITRVALVQHTSDINDPAELTVALPLALFMTAQKQLPLIA